MKSRNQKLKDEADFQDLKVTQNIRKQTDIFYHDEAMAYVAEQKSELIGKIANKQILEIGCGKGEETIKMLQEGAWVTAIDISPKSIELTKRKATDLKLDHRLNAMVMDAQYLELDHEIFDIVIGNGILHHLPELDQTMLEISRVLKPTGFAVFMEPLGMNPFLKLYRILTPKLRTKDEKPFTTRELILIKKYFPAAQYMFFDCVTLISKLFSMIGAKKVARWMQKRLIGIDAYLLRDRSKLTLAQKMSWIVLMKLQKRKTCEK